MPELETIIYEAIFTIFPDLTCNCKEIENAVLDIEDNEPIAFSEKKQPIEATHKRNRKKKSPKSKENPAQENQTFELNSP